MATQLEKAAEVIERETLRAKAAEQQRDRLLEATKKVRGTASRSVPDYVVALEGLYDLAVAIESEVGK
jgi:hypothetical protein